MVKEFKNKKEWALILGGSSGLGLATAKKLAKHGMNICIVHRNSRSQLDQIEKGFKKINQEAIAFVSYNTDAFHKEKRTSLIEKLKIKLEGGKIKVLVHSIAKGNLKPMISDSMPILQTDDFQLTIQAMGISLYDWVKAVFEAKMFSADARVVSFTSEGNSKAWKSYAAVSAAKVTLEAITRSIALEYARFGIRANCIQAGVTNTASLRMIPASDDIKKHSLLRNPFKRLTLPEDVANVVYLLSKDEAAWINGTIIPVDGGEHVS
ncbi:MAG: short-chain dehydrogenase [Flavobacteriaceae bacterium]|nr:short-chain dehydrogenase [Flavobacteriaceae bacterium]|tara:strand:- start:2914 stop:3708 length:795 start_codon:yes stop_codon:yes gene_type:complete